MSFNSCEGGFKVNMNTQPNALRLADLLEDEFIVSVYFDAATELRRLHALNQELLNSLELLCAKCRSNEWGPDTPRTEILNWMHDHAAVVIAKAET